MTIRDIVLLAALTLLAGLSALAHEARRGAFDESKFPREVRQSLRYAREECTPQGGGTVTFAPDTVRTLDLTGDGRDDYIVDLRDTQCAERLSVYCGTAGCSLDILVALPNGSHRLVFSDRVRGYEILPGEGAKKTAKTVRFELHGSYCGRSGNPSCLKEQIISAETFAFKEAK